MKLTASQQAIFDEEIPHLRDRLELRKSLMGLPSKKDRAAAVDRLRIAVDDLRAAGKPFIGGPPGFLSPETIDWISEVDAVSAELSKRSKPSKIQAFSAGIERPNEYRRWLIGEAIPELCQKVFGKRFANTLKILGEDDISDETIKVVVTKVRGRGRASKTRT